MKQSWLVSKANLTSGFGLIRVLKGIVSLQTPPLEATKTPWNNPVSATTKFKIESEKYVSVLSTNKKYLKSVICEVSILLLINLVVSPKQLKLGTTSPAIGSLYKYTKTESVYEQPKVSISCTLYFPLVSISNVSAV